MLTVALAKGRLEEQAIRLFTCSGARLRSGKSRSRALVQETIGGSLRFLSVKPADVATYVEHGIADMGVVGLDVLAEREPDVYQPLDLGFGKCRLVVAGPVGSPRLKHFEGGLRVGTKYPVIARRYFEGLGFPVEIIELTGSVELAPRVGLSDLIVDVVETGSTLKANGLVVAAEIMKSSARVVVNRASHKVRLEEVRLWLGRLRKAGKAGRA